MTDNTFKLLRPTATTVNLSQHDINRPVTLVNLVRLFCLLQNVRYFSKWDYMRINVFQHIRDFTTMRYINLRFTQLPTYSLTRSTRVTSLKFTWLAQPLKNEMVCYSASLWQITAQCATFSCIKTRYFFMKQVNQSSTLSRISLYIFMAVRNLLGPLALGYVAIFANSCLRFSDFRRVIVVRNHSGNTPALIFISRSLQVLDTNLTGRSIS